MSAVLQLVAREQSIPDDNIAVLSFGGAFWRNCLGERLAACGPPSSARAVAVLPAQRANSWR